jgi:hypothetical protein
MEMEQQEGGVAETLYQPPQDLTPLAILATLEMLKTNLNEIPPRKKLMSLVEGLLINKP